MDRKEWRIEKKNWMRNNFAIDKIGLKSNCGFPDEAYCFTDGILSVQIERNGGVNELHYLSILKEDDTFYPDRSALPVFSKSHVTPAKYSYGLYGPVLRFISKTKNGRNLYHVPDKLMILPFGFISSSDRFGIHTEYSMCIKERFIIFSFKNSAKDKESLDLLLITPGLISGEMGTWKKQRGEGCKGKGFELPLIAGLEKEEVSKDWKEEVEKFKGDKKYLKYINERKAQLIWEDFRFDKSKNCFYVPGVARFYYGDEPLCVAISSNAGITIEKEEYDYKIISTSWKGKEEIQFYINIEGTLKDCISSIKEVSKNPRRPWQIQIKHYTEIANRIPEIDIKGYPVASDMARTIPLFINAMKLNETEAMVTTRGATHKFAYFLGWDGLLVARAMLLWGEYRFVKKIIEYLMTQLGRNYSWNDFIFICLTGEYYNLTRDKEILDKYYSKIKDEFLRQISDCDEKGMKVGGTFAVDNFAQLKYPKKPIPSDGIGWLYNAARMMENMAMIEGDEELEVRARDIAMKIEKSYIPTFYDEEVGFLASAVDSETGKRVKVYHNVATMAMHGLYGDILLYDKLNDIAKFIKNQLYHPSGRSAVPFWDIADEMWKSCIMLQHAPHESRVLRFAGETEELLRMWQVYMKLFDETKLQIETLNLCGGPYDAVGQRADWQAFGASGQYEVLLYGITGIELDYCGITYSPCDMGLDTSIKKLLHGNTMWDIGISGKGKWVESMYVDGKKVIGCMKVPAKYFEGGKHILEMKRGIKAPETPYLLRVVNAGITVRELTRHKLIADLIGTGRIPLRFFSPQKPKSCKFNKKEIGYKWNESKKTGLAEVLLKNEGEFSIQE